MTPAEMKAAFVVDLDGVTSGLVMPPTPTYEELLELVTRNVMRLDARSREGFLEAFGEPWSLLIVLNSDHPSLLEVTGWDGGADDDPPILFLATPAGPPPPQVFVFEPAAP